MVVFEKCAFYSTFVRGEDGRLHSEPPPPGGGALLPQPSQKHKDTKAATCHATMALSPDQKRQWVGSSLSHPKARRKVALGPLPLWITRTGWVRSVQWEIGAGRKRSSFQGRFVLKQGLV